MMQQIRGPTTKVLLRDRPVALMTRPPTARAEARVNLVGVVPARHNRQVVETEMHRAQITVVFLVLTESGEGALGKPLPGLPRPRPRSLLRPRKKARTSKVA